jgi:hypothetical protein
MDMPPPPANYGFHLIVVDNGAPGPFPPGGPDQADLVLAGPAAPTTCVGVSAGHLGPTSSGDIVVHDAQALPTSKAQCRNGGWAEFGFKNQGQCIRFVRLIPGTPPYPTTKEQCRHGGWAQFGFRNERRCLRFVRLTPNP